VFAVGEFQSSGHWHRLLSSLRKTHGIKSGTCVHKQQTWDRNH